MLDAVAVRREARVVGERGKAERHAQPAATGVREPTATAISPSAVSNVSYGTMFGWALPRRPGATPETNAFWAWLTSAASVEARSEMSIRWPRPDAGPGSARGRPAPPGRSTAPSIPVTTSLIATPTFVGRPPSSSAAPVIDISPLDGLDDEVVARSIGGRAVGAVAARSRGGRGAGSARCERRRRRSRAARSRRPGSSRRGRRHRPRSRRRTSRPRRSRGRAGCERLFRLTAR